MRREIVSCVLVASLMLCVGCYNTELVTKEGLKARTEQCDITVSTKDSLDYTFLKDNYRIQGDTLTGYGVRRSTGLSEVVLDASLPFANITSIAYKEFSPWKTIALCGGVGLGVLIVSELLFRQNQSLVIAPAFVSEPAGKTGPKD
jgi:hypothetical protein